MKSFTSIGLFTLVSVLSNGSTAQDLLIREARIVPVDGAEIPTGDIYIKDGKIAGIGKDLQVPAEVPTLPAVGLVAYPGFVLAHTSSGMDAANEQVPITPYVSVVDSLDPASNFFEDCQRDGVLTIGVFPGERTIIGGMGRVVQPAGILVEDMTVIPDAGLKLSMIPAQGSRASHLAKLRAALDEAQKYWKDLQAKAKDQKETGNVSLDLEAFRAERRKSALVRLLKKEIPAIIACENGGDIQRALELIDQYQLNAKLYCLPGTWRGAHLLAKREIPVLLSADLEIEEVDPETGKDVVRIVPRIFQEAGVKFAVVSGQGSLGRRYLWYQAASLIRYGFKREDALRAVTLAPAEFLGLGAKKGSLTVGKDADIVLFTDDPIGGMAWVDRAFIRGQKAYDRRKDPRLSDLIGGAAK